MLARASRLSSTGAAGSFAAAPAVQVASTWYLSPTAPSRTTLTRTSIGTSSRLLTSSTTRSLPRQLRRRSIQVDEHQQQEEDSLRTSSSTQSSNVSDELSGTDPSIPWFLQTETIDPPPADDASPLTTIHISTATNTFSYIPAAPKAEEPKAINKLKAHLRSGPSANLVARPSEDDDQLTPVTLIHPASLSKDPSSHAYGTNHWIVVVQVKSSAAGSVRRVALDIGKFLKHTRPPAMEAEIDLDDFLGPDPSAPRYHTKPSTPKTITSTTPAPPGPRPKGMSRIEHELGKRLPRWAVHRIALQKKFPDGWRPPKILSREAQEGIRLLHASDPEQFDVVQLSTRFRVSTESIRRILRSKWAVSGKVRSRQDRRAAERATERQDLELAGIRRLQEEQSQLVDQGESPAIKEDEFAEEIDEDDGTPGIQPVRYEGLVMSASDASALGVTSKLKTGGRNGDGNWCLVDADWCMVHVMTEQARFNYDIEGIWRELEVGKSIKPKPCEDQQFSSSASAIASAKPSSSTRRRSRDVFGERLGKRSRNSTDNADVKFGSGSRTFSTSVRRCLPAKVPESLSAVLSSAASTFASGEATSIPVSVTGWLRSARKQKSITFLELSDGSLPGSLALQAIVKSNKDSPTSEIDRLAGLTVGTALRLTGHLKPGRGTKAGQNVELEATSLKVLAGCDLTYPLAAVSMQQATTTVVEEGGYSASLAERRNPHLLGRLARYGAVARTRQRLEQGMASFLSGHEFVKIACPILTSSDCEGAGETFQVVPAHGPGKDAATSSFWGEGGAAYLTVSSQLHLEAAGLGLGRVWTLNPAFRAEASATNRHLCEFWMLEAEMYFTHLNGILDVAEGMVKCGIRNALATAVARRDMEVLGDATHIAKLEDVVQAEWKRITYHDAHTLLALAPSGTFDVEPNVEDGLASEHEKYLSGQLGPVFVTHYPVEHKAFYMKRAEHDGLVECFDLLIPNLGELIGGSMREHRPHHLAHTIKQLNLNLNSNSATEPKLGWYLDDLKKFGGAVEHGGFGMGVERLLAWVSNTQSVKDVVPFPRVKGPIRF